jgi:hypothetical protein
MRGTVEDINSQKKERKYRAKEQKGRYRLAKKKKGRYRANKKRRRSQ